MRLDEVAVLDALPVDQDFTVRKERFGRMRLDGLCFLVAVFCRYVVIRRQMRSGFLMRDDRCAGLPNHCVAADLIEMPVRVEQRVHATCAWQHA